MFNTTQNFNVYASKSASVAPTSEVRTTATLVIIVYLRNFKATRWSGL